MPKKVYDDDKLRKRALELRRKGYSFRQIANELGCSVYKAYELVSQYEKPSHRLRQAIELADKVEKISSEVETLTKKLEELNLKASKIESMEDLSKKLSELEESLTNLNKSLSKISEKVSSLEDEVERISDDIQWIHLSVERRILKRHKKCIWLDEDGFCKILYFDKRIEGLVMRPEEEEGKIVYLLNVKKYPLICTACPYYKSEETT